MTTTTQNLDARLAALKASLAELKRETRGERQTSFIEREWKIGFWAVVVGVAVKAINEMLNS